MIVENINRVMEDYKADYSIWREDDDDMMNLKQAIDSLSESDRIIFVLYCEYGSLRKVGKKLGVSHSIIYKNVRRIKLQMLQWIKSNTNNEELIERMENILYEEDGEVEDDD